MTDLILTTTEIIVTTLMLEVVIYLIGKKLGY